jgi:hypothetical protein
MLAEQNFGAISQGMPVCGLEARLISDDDGFLGNRSKFLTFICEVS